MARVSGGAVLAPGSSGLPSANALPANIIGHRRGLNNTLNNVSSERIACIGTSATRGFGQGVDGVGYPGDLPQVLTGRGFSAARGLCIPEYQRGGQAVDPRIAYGGTWAVTGTNNGNGWGGANNIWQGNVAGGALAFTPGTACDTFDIYYYQTFTSGQVTASIDGQAGTVINTVGALSIQKATVTATNGVQANHVLSLSTVTTASVFIIGIEAYNSVARQLVIANMGVNSQNTTQWSGVGAAGVGPLDCLRAYNPSLSFLMFGANDAGQGLAVAPFVANVKTIGQAAAAGGGSVVICSHTPMAPAALGYALMDSYGPALQALAQQNGWLFLDLYSRFGGLGGYNTLNPLGWYFDTVHLDQAGYFDIATSIATLLSAV